MALPSLARLKLETPVHMNNSGDIFEDIADTYCLLVTLQYDRRHNIIFANDT
jgi:hypothetical protein